MEKRAEARRCEALRHRAARVAAWPAPRPALLETALLALSLAVCLAAVAGLFA